MEKEAYSSSFMAVFLSRGKKKPDSRDYHKYVGWLHYTGELDNYLDRSISYIYMRDLGMDLDSPDTKARIRRVAQDTKTSASPYQ